MNNWFASKKIPFSWCFWKLYSFDQITPFAKSFPVKGAPKNPWAPMPGIFGTDPKLVTSRHLKRQALLGWHRENLPVQSRKTKGWSLKKGAIFFETPIFSHLPKAFFHFGFQQKCEFSRGVQVWTLGKKQCMSRVTTNYN